jgi:hypothetical protein
LNILKGASIMDPIDRMTSPISGDNADTDEGEGLSSSVAAQSRKTTSPFEYSQQSPVKEVDPEHVKAIAQIYSEGIGEYATDKDGALMKPPKSKRIRLDPRRSADKKNLKGLAERWNRRSADAQELGHRIGVRGSSEYQFTGRVDAGSGRTPTFAFELAGKPAAMMLLKQSQNETEVATLSTHPGTSGAGETMIERAVNESQVAGHNGEVSLTSLNHASTKFYESLGFKQQGSEMKLKPAERSDLWSQKDGTWTLNKHENHGYLSEAETKKENEPAKDIQPSPIE